MDEKRIPGTGYRCEQEKEIQVRKMKARARQRVKQLEDRIREEGSGPRFHDVPPSSICDLICVLLDISNTS